MNEMLIIKESLSRLLASIFWLVVAWVFVIGILWIAYVGIVRFDPDIIANTIFLVPIALWILYLLIKHIDYCFGLFDFLIKNPYLNIEDDGITIYHYEINTKPVFIHWSDIKVAFAKQDLQGNHFNIKNAKNESENKKLLIYTKAVNLSRGSII
ncbi:hypothetical protein LP109_05840 [Moraxella bovis]|nr:hypothetical protein [Moraxella bovis]UYZ67479.1 hypothetical protein LP122_06665 [Moraxella bovis]UYZ69839.1 hypothetical protein LP089_06710 [Moraxella bovis]UYZ74240.1 hypothetical protein LP105_05960 [Moraxella bovis]UYZ88354.1 hypothetical protein LP114_07670 [Moraxella bovis]UYZ93884.1 hypothetical protein LP121_08225 [Moraxella bovis]